MKLCSSVEDLWMLVTKVLLTILPGAYNTLLFKIEHQTIDGLKALILLLKINPPVVTNVSDYFHETP